MGWALDATTNRTVGARCATPGQLGSVPIELRRHIPAWVPWAGALVVALAAAPGLWGLLHVDPGGPPVLEEGATLVIDRRALADVDLKLVHTELMPDWVVARGGVKRSHWHRLRREAGHDANLGAMLDRVDELVRGGPVQNAAEIFTLLGVWNTYLTKAGYPWRVSGEIVPDVTGGALRLKTYEVLFDDAAVTVGSRSFPVSVRRRADATTQLDAWLGHVHSHEEGVVLLLDEVAAFATDRVWPMLDEALDSELNPLQASFAVAVRDEVAAALPPGDLAVLRATAEDRLWMLRVVRSVHARHECGSQFLVSRLPWWGLSPEELATVRLHVDDEASEPCPEVTELEALVFATRSHHLRLQRGLGPALERLVAFVARAVAVHEARHAADVESGQEPTWTCEDCSLRHSRISSLEGSAYLASFAHEGSAALSMFQACGLDPALLPERGAVVRELASRLGVDCAEPPPDDLAARASDLEARLIGPRGSIEVTRFPPRLPLPR